ncbi:25S rRNA (cytosine-C(5))-methyltransferase nop2-like [Thrips palmi]|uniref:25S rRNA (Cytosine-C(5))-methyltransferase nop2-like n=1 Tax=Thrips palmi TaxID=161013 RepID=A0A6P8YZG4_THRPL|nr:25S rRNA (cytosine-C(5))-methyltransferase nop2-like [Thrips palmi]
MGRKAKFADPDYKKKGPGRKARKQGEPEISVPVGVNSDKKLTRRPLARMRKRNIQEKLKAEQAEAHRIEAQKKRELKNKQMKEELAAKAKSVALQQKGSKQPPPKAQKGRKYQSSSEEEEESEEDDQEEEEESDDESDDEGNNVVGFTDDNSSWLKPVLKKGAKVPKLHDQEGSDDDDSEEESDADSDDDEEEESDADSDGEEEESAADSDGEEEEESEADSDEMEGDEEVESGDSDDKETSITVPKKWKPGKGESVTVQSLNMDSDDSDEDDDDDFGGDSDNSDKDSDDNSDKDSDDENDDSDDNEESDEDMLPIEKQAKKLRKKQKRDDKLAEEELQLNVASHDVFAFPSEEEVKKPQDLQDVQQRMKDVIIVLNDFKKLHEPGRSRSDYVDLLRHDLCTYYSYNDFLMEKLMQVFQLSELLEFLEASEVQRPLTIRVNSLKARRKDVAQALINRGVNLDPLGEWTKVGLVVYSSQVPIGATPEYLAGHYIIQGASSLLPVMALAPQEKERILDMAAAPGGKASHIAAVMKNTGVLFANDANRDRTKAIVGNFHRLGIVNSVVTCYDGRKITNVLKGFDRVLLDAPCTGTGVVSKDPSVKSNKDEIDIQRCCTLQRELLLAAIDALNARSSTGGYLVYSTCSVLVEENEWVIDYALKKRAVRLVPTGLDFGSEGFTKFRQLRFHPSLKLTRRFYPHTHNMDGFFVAKLQKISNSLPKTVDIDANEEDSGVYQVDAIEKETVTSDVKEDEAPGTTSSKKKKNLKKKAKKNAKKKTATSDNSQVEEKSSPTEKKIKKPKKKKESSGNNGGSESSVSPSQSKGPKGNKNKANGNDRNVLLSKKSNGNASKVIANGVASKGKRKNSGSVSETKSPKKKARKHV